MVAEEEDLEEIHLEVVDSEEVVPVVGSGAVRVLVDLEVVAEEVVPVVVEVGYLYFY